MKNNNQQDLSFDINLEKTERSYSYGEPRVGRRAIDGLSATADNIEVLKKRINSIRVSDEDLKHLKDLVKQFENLPTGDVIESHGKLTTDPYISVSDGEIISVDIEVTKKWMNSETFKEIQARFNESDEVEFTNLNISLIDEKTASISYEINQGGNVGQSAIIAVKQENNWKVGVHVQHPIG